MTAKPQPEDWDAAMDTELARHSRWARIQAAGDRAEAEGGDVAAAWAAEHAKIREELGLGPDDHVSLFDGWDQDAP